MLTKDDLKEIQKIVKTEVRGEVESALKAKIDPFRTEMQEKLNAVISGFDNEYMGLRRRVEPLSVTSISKLRRLPSL